MRISAIADGATFISVAPGDPEQVKSARSPVSISNDGGDCDRNLILVSLSDSDLEGTSSSIRVVRRPRRPAPDEVTLLSTASVPAVFTWSA